MKYNIELIETLYKKYQEEGTINYRRLLIEDYEKATGNAIPISTLEKYIARIKIKPKTFNERTDEIIDLPTEPYNEQAIIIAMGFDPTKFMIERITVNRWWTDGIPSEEDLLKRIKSGQIKAQLKPRRFEFSEESINELIELANVSQIWVDESVDKPSGLLELTLTDMHFGKNTYENYKPHQDKVMRWIKSKEWQEVLIPIGNDLFHWDNVNGTTTAGTQVGFEPNLDETWEDAIKFYFPIIEEAIRQSIDVYIPYIKGNHDATLGWAFAKMVEKTFPQAIVDTSIDNYKLHTWEKIAIGLSHGNEPRDFKKYSKIFNELYRMELAQAEVREIHLGDKHHQMIHDEFGIVTRGLSTASNTDQWHYNKGFIGASKCFQAFIYTEDSIEAMVFI